MALYGASPVSTQRHPITHWVTFRGESTPAVRSSGNVSSITDRGSGYFGVTFSTSMPDINYCIFGNTIKGDLSPVIMIDPVKIEKNKIKKIFFFLSFKLLSKQKPIIPKNNINAPAFLSNPNGPANLCNVWSFQFSNGYSIIPFI